MSLPLAALLVIVSITLQALFVGSEMALTSIDKSRLERSMEGNGGTATQRAVLAFLEEPSWILGTTLLGVNACLAATASVVVWASWSTLGPHGGWLVLALLPLTLLAGEILPKSYFQARPYLWAARFIWPLRFLAALFRPLLSLMASFSHLIAPGPDAGRERQPFVLREELKLRIQDSSSTPELGRMEREMLTRIFNFRKTTVEDVMVSLVDVRMAEETTPLLGAVEELVDRGHSRLPVFQSRVDNIVGILYAFDVLYEQDLDQPIKGFARTPCYVPEHMPIPKLLLELRKQRVGMAVVVDEYGGAVGVVTLEDVLEEIVGDIEDEYDQKEQMWRRVGPQEYLVDARMEVEDLERLLGVPLPQGDYETVAGFLLWTFGRIPGAGSVHRHGRLTFIVRKCTDRAIREVSVFLR